MGNGAVGCVGWELDSFSNIMLINECWQDVDDMLINGEYQDIMY